MNYIQTVVRSYDVHKMGTKTLLDLLKKKGVWEKIQSVYLHMHKGSASFYDHLKK